MYDDSFVYEGQKYKTGDYIEAQFDSTKVFDAKIYVCSQKEIEDIVENNGNWIAIVFILNNLYQRFSLYGKRKMPDTLGYNKVIATGLRRDSIGWSDGVKWIRLAEKDALKRVVDEVIKSDRQAIERRRTLI